MNLSSRWSDPDTRWLLLSHVLFGVTLGVPTALVVASDQPVAARALTVAIAGAFAGWYGGFATHPAWLEHRAGAVVHAAGLLTFYTVLSLRGDAYFLLVYSLLPLLFATLPRALAVLATIGLVVLPTAFSGGPRQLLEDRTAFFNLLASVGLGLVITAVIEALDRVTERQQETIGDLERARSEIAQLLDGTRQDLRARDALARAGHALIAARTPDRVMAALATELAGHRMEVRGVALLATDPEDRGRARVLDAVPGAASPHPGSAIRLPWPPSDRGVALLTAGEFAATAHAPAEGVHAVALLPLGAEVTPRRDGGRAEGIADLLWLSLGTATLDEPTMRDLSTVATETALALSNLRLAASAAEQGRTAGILAERQRLAHEIHDTLAQGFTSIVTQLEAADQVLTTDAGTARRHIDRARRTARENLNEARRTVEALRPHALDRAALPDALRDVVTRWRAAHDGQVEVNVTVDGRPPAGPHDTDAALLRIAQEALTNVARHAHASRVDLTLSYLDDLVLLDVQDDGVGFTIGGAPTANAGSGGYGLVSMRERMQGVGGELVVESAPGDGTTIAARVPLRDRDRAAVTDDTRPNRDRAAATDDTRPDRDRAAVTEDTRPDGDDAEERR